MELRLKVRVVVAVLLLVGAAGARSEWGEAERESDQDWYRALVEWIQDFGGEGLVKNRVAIENVPGMGMGLVTTTDLEADTVVTSTPLSVLLNVEHALSSEEFGCLADDLYDLSSTNLKALFLGFERERGNESFWAPYLQSLPSEVHSTLFFSEVELEELQASLVKEFSKRQQAAANKAFQRVELSVDRFPQVFPNLTREALYWGLAIWSSRAHRVRVRDRNGQWQMASCLVPLADMFNMALTASDSNVRCDTNEDSTHFLCNTTKPVAAGTQLLVNYISNPEMRHNGQLLMYYGYVAQGNPYDSVSVKPPEIDRGSQSYSTRVKLAESLPLMKQPFFQLSRPTSTRPTVVELVSIMRLLLGSVSEITKASRLPHPFSEPLGVKSERRALREAAEYLEQLLGRYPTTPEEDENILGREGTELLTRARNAVVLRLEEKLLLRENVAHLRQLLSRLSGTSEAQAHTRSEL